MSLPLTWADKKNSPLLEDFIVKHGAEYCMTAEEINELRDAVNEMAVIQQSVFLGSAEPADTPTGTGNAYWEVIVPGTYTDFGGVVLSSNSRGLIYRDAEGNFSISQSGLDLSGKANVTDLNKKPIRNAAIVTYEPVTWLGEVFTWEYEIKVVLNTQTLFNIAAGNKTIPQNHNLIASLNSSSFVPLTEDVEGSTTAYAIVVDNFFNLQQKGCFVIGKNYSTKWTSNYIHMIPKYWELNYTNDNAIAAVSPLLNAIGVESELHSKNGILNPTLPLFWNEFFGSQTIKLTTVPDFLKNQGLEYFIKIVPDNGSTDVEKYIQATVTNGLIIPKVNQWVKWSYYIYAPNLSIEPFAIDRLRMLWLGGTQFSSASATMRKVADNVYQVSGLSQFTGNPAEKATLWIENILKKVSGATFSNTDFIYISAIQMGYSDNKDFFLRDGILYDYKMLSQQTTELVKDTSYNNLAYNSAMLSEFLRKYEMKEVDDFNQLAIVMVGDSICGRQTETEMSITQDTNGETGNGYITGHFPPNMWNENIAFKILQMLQFPDADVKYFNHVASEVVKNGIWTDLYPLGADALRCALTTQDFGNAVLSFTGATHAKVIFSSYYGTGTGVGQNMRATVSTDNGATWVTPESLGLVCSQPVFNQGDGTFITGTQEHKFFQVNWKGFNPATSYKLKCSNIFGNAYVLWGFETWSKARINVIVTAEGGNTAANQLARWERFYSKYYNPSLVIYEVPYLNDLGSGIIPDGASAGAIATALQNYNNNNNSVLNRLSTLGIPVLTLITHNSSSFYPSKPYTFQNGLSIIRNLVAKYGFASIDANYYQMNNGFATAILSDGTHLNDTGVEMYRSLLAELLDIDYTNRVVGTGSFVNKRKVGTGTGAGTIAFGYEFSKVPIVRIYGNSSITITAVTTSGFTTTGTGNFDYEAFVN